MLNYKKKKNHGFLEEIFRIYSDKKFHGFACTSELASIFPFYSVDSSTAIQNRRFKKLWFIY